MAPNLTHSVDDKQNTTSIADEIETDFFVGTSSLLKNLEEKSETNLKILKTQQNQILLSKALEFLSVEVYQILNIYKNNGFSQFYHLIKPLMFGVGRIVTIKNYTVIMDSSKISHATAGAVAVTVTPPQQDYENVPTIKRCKLLGLSNTTGALMVKVLNDTSSISCDTIYEIINGEVFIED